MNGGTDGKIAGTNARVLWRFGWAARMVLLALESRRFYPEELSTLSGSRFIGGDSIRSSWNAPFLSLPKPASVKGWLRFATYNFRFCVK